MENASCSICRNISGNKSFVAREMNFGFRDQFEYFECALCGCVQIGQIPRDLSRYYPPDYYPPPHADDTEKAWAAFLKHQRARACLSGYGTNPLGTLLVKICGRPTSEIFGAPDHYTWFKRCQVVFSSEILEIGCGRGSLLLSLSKDGFSHLTGVDPFIKDSLAYGGRVRILKTNIYQVDQEFDFIMLHHTFEHMPEPLAVLKQIWRLLKPARYVLLRIPVASSFAYRKYGADWGQLDAPRHLFLHTVKSLHVLAAAAGFQVAAITYDSTDFQFWASEQYVANIPLRDMRSYMMNSANSMFSRQQIQEFSEAAIELNKRNDGDSACFYLYKA